MKYLFVAIAGVVLSGAAYAADTPAKPTAKQHASAPKTAHATGGDANAQGTEKNDHLVLDSTVVTGNRELPKVMYIVPWKKADLGDLPGQPFNTLLDEALTPVDRDVFRREVQYYQVIANKDRGVAEQATPKNDSR